MWLHYVICIIALLLCDWTDPTARVSSSTSTARAVVLEQVQNLEIFEEIQPNSHIRFNLLLDADELALYGGVEAVTLCLVINGGVCQCSTDQLARIGINLHEKCKPSPSWSFYFVSVLISLPNFKKTQSSNPLVVYRLPVPALVDTVVASDSSDDTQQVSSIVKQIPFHFDRVTFLLLITLDDLSRATVLLHSFHRFTEDVSLVLELIVFTPDDQLSLISTALQGFNTSLPFPIRVLPDSILFHGNYSTWPHKDAYAVQMAIKLVAAKVIRSYFYLTFDADIVQLRPFSLHDIVHTISVTQGPGPGVDNCTLRQLVIKQRAVYHHESYYAHPHWWEGSKYFLNMDDVSNDDLAFGVTPAILSTWGSLATVGHARMTIGLGIPSVTFDRTYLVEDCVDDNSVMIQACHRQFLDNFNQEEIERIWVVSLGINDIVWTEYTMYRTVLTNYRVFDQLHIREEEAGLFLHCNNVWYAHELPWKAQEAFANESCLFSVVQSTTGVAPVKVLRAFEQSKLTLSKEIMQ